MPNPESPKQAGTPPEALTAAVQRLLRPLVGLLLEHGLTYVWLSGLLKSLFVDVAAQEFQLPGKNLTNSRITLLTGVHRKDVRRLREELLRDSPPPATVFLGAQLVALWTSEARFLDNERVPKPLLRFAGDSDEPSFEDLVTAISKDIRPRSVLDEWLRLGVVEIDADGRVRLKSAAFIPAKGFDEKAYYLGRNVHDHLAAARHNVQSNDPSRLERSVYYDGLTPKSIDALAELSEEEAVKALKTVNRRARQLQARDRGANEANYRMNFGVYFYDTEDESDV
ncbi:MAG: DUF6502 family protein [Gammaproteobacteria bacterium]|nr:DUF6502 family protein [Gammaproteobacteria bacterium]MDH3465455.1 DUF6502 family protein [Gammaproteobacteria bacterium]